MLFFFPIDQNTKINTFKKAKKTTVTWNTISSKSFCCLPPIHSTPCHLPPTDIYMHLHTHVSVTSKLRHECCSTTKLQVQRGQRRSTQTEEEGGCFFLFIPSGCETSYCFHLPRSLCRSQLMRASRTHTHSTHAPTPCPNNTEEVVQLISDPWQKTHTSTTLLRWHAKLLSLNFSSVPAAFQPRLHRPNTDRRVKPQKRYLGKKCWKTLTSSAGAGRGRAQGERREWAVRVLGEKLTPAEVLQKCVFEIYLF